MVHIWPIYVQSHSQRDVHLYFFTHTYLDVSTQIEGFIQT